jgi:hypothetical protein
VTTEELMSMPELPGPINYLDLEHTESVALSVTSIEVGRTLIHPTIPTARHRTFFMQQNGLQSAPDAGTPISVWVYTVRLNGQRLDQPSQFAHWDITSSHLAHDLVARFGARVLTPMAVKISATGHKPRKVFSVESL